MGLLGTEGKKIAGILSRVEKETDFGDAEKLALRFPGISEQVIARFQQSSISIAVSTILIRMYYATTLKRSANSYFQNADSVNKGIYQYWQEYYREQGYTNRDAKNTAKNVDISYLGRFIEFFVGFLRDKYPNSDEQPFPSEILDDFSVFCAPIKDFCVKDFFAGESAAIPLIEDCITETVRLLSP